MYPTLQPSTWALNTAAVSSSSLKYRIYLNVYLPSRPFINLFTSPRTPSLTHTHTHGHLVPDKNGGNSIPIRGPNQPRQRPTLPFASVAAFEGWFNRKLAVCKQCRKAAPDVPAFQFGEFVLVHQDISPRNLVLDGDGQVWLVDWADAGAYPPGFETAALVGQASFPDFQALVLERVDFERNRVLEEGLRAIEWGVLTAVLA